MSRRVGHEWMLSGVRAFRRRTTKQHLPAGAVPFHRRLRLEPLEDRRLLATFLVDNLNDAGSGSLRQAILDANGMAGADTIEFPAVTGTIALTSGEMEITEALAIDGPGKDVLTINAQQASRIFNITAPTGDIAIDGLTLTGGTTTGDNADMDDTTHSGGAIRSLTTGNLTITNSSVSGNSTSGADADGGGILAIGDIALTNSIVSGNHTSGYAGYGGGIFGAANVTLTNSTVSGNHTVGDYAAGGGVYGAAEVTLTNSTVSGNHTRGASADGGGVYSYNGNMTLTNTTVSGNHTEGENASGGGVFAGQDLALNQSSVSGNHTLGFSAVGGGVYNYGDATLVDSTVSGNHTEGDEAGGGGIYGYGNITLSNSTVSGNRTEGEAAHGGGIYAYADLTIAHSTISGNRTEGANSDGGGIYVFLGSTTLDGSIVAGNTASGSNPDLLPAPAPATLTVNFSLIGNNAGTSLAPAPVGSPDANGNLIGSNVSPIIPMLGPLANNGGPTMTHALLPGSPAIDAGDPAAVAGIGDVPLHDQRGAPFERVFNGDGVGGARIDMGAFEVQPSGPALLGDYNLNNEVDAADYVAWRNTLGTSGVPAFSGADGDGDGTIDQDDYGVWRANFGRTLPGSGSGVGAGAADPHPSPLPKGEGIVVGSAGQITSGNLAEALAEPVAPAQLPPALPGGRVAVGWNQIAADVRRAEPPAEPGADERNANAAAISGLAGARRDAALMAWLTSRTADQRQTDEPADPIRDESNESSRTSMDESLDLVFATLALAG